MGERGDLIGSGVPTGSPLRTNLFRNSFFLLARSFLSYGLGFVFWIIVARYYAPAVVGIGAVMLSVLLLLARVAALGLPTGMLRYLPTHDDRTGVINGSFTVSTLSSLLVGAAFLGGIGLWAPALSILLGDAALAAIFLLSLICFTLDGVVDNAFVAVRRADYGMIRSTVFYALRLPLAIAFAALGLFGVLFSWTFSLLVSLVGMGLLLPKFYPGYRPRPTIRPVRRAGIIGYSFWNYATGLVSGAAIFLLPLLIVNLLGPRLGPTQSAFFYTAYSFGSLLYLVPSAFTTALLVEGSHPGTSYAQDTRQALRFSMGLLAVGIAGTVVLGRWVLAIFGAAYAAASYETLLVLAFASPVVLATSIYTTHYQVAKRVRAMFLINAVAAGVTLTVAYVLILSIGIIGAAVAFAGGQLLAVALYAIEGRLHASKAAGASGATAGPEAP